MGATCCYSVLTPIIRKANSLNNETNVKIENYEKEIMNFKISKEKKKKDILNEINNLDDFNIENKVSEFYKLQSQESDKSKILSSLKHQISDLKNLLEKIKNKSNKQYDIDRIDKDFRNIENKIKSLYSNEADNSNQNDSKNDLKSENIEKINKLCELKNKLISEKNNTKLKKENIEQIINQKSGQTFQYANKMENSLQIYEEELNANNKQIKEAIISILENKSPPIENETIRKIEENNEKTKINFRKEEISLKIENVRSLLNTIGTIKDYFLSENLKCQKMVDSIEEKKKEINSQYYIIETYNENKDINLNKLNNKKNNIIEYQKSILAKIDKLSQMDNELNSLNETNINFENDYIYKQTINSLENLENKINSEINNSNNMKKSFIILEAKTEIQNMVQNDSFLIQDTFYNRKDKLDITYNKLLEEEKRIIMNTFYSNQEKIMNIISKDNKLKSLSFKDYNIIKGIISNKSIYNFIKYRIINRIKDISEDDEKFKISNINILLVGRKGIGKTALIKYILGDNVSGNTINDFFTMYTSQGNNNFNIIEVKGVSNINSPSFIEKKINEFIKERNKVNDKQDYNNIINCIWYCITGNRFEEDEETLFLSLRKIYKENNIPIILVFTKADEEEEVNRMKNSLKDGNNKIDNEFIPVIAEEEDGKKVKGKKELIDATLEKFKTALDGDIQKIMIEQIIKYIEFSLNKENENIIKEIKNMTLNYFNNNFKYAFNDEGFILEIRKIFFKYLNLFCDQKYIISKESFDLFLKSDFISSIKQIYLSYKEIIKEIIKQISKEKSKELINIQAIIEKKYQNMNLKNKRDINEFISTTEIFLKKNYYIFIQNYIINFIINNGLFLNFLKSIKDEFGLKIKSLIYSSNNEQNWDLNENLKFCFSKKLKSYRKNE